MNIKQVQQLSGISADNIRFYEKQGLLRPARNPENDYRDYSAQDLRRLKLIRALRMLDMPLEQIRDVLSGRLPLSQAAEEQHKRLLDRSRRLSEAIRFCGEFVSLPGIDVLDVDALLARMDAPESSGGFFQGWLQDYRRLSLSQHEKRFTFLPDEAVTTPQEFTAALARYARDNGLDLVMLKEGMYPRFTLGGIEYTAQRNYTAIRGCPLASIACEAAHPENFEPHGVSPTRQRILKLFYYLRLPALLFLLILLPRLDLLATAQGRAILLVLLTATAALSLRSWLLFHNENGKRG